MTDLRPCSWLFDLDGTLVDSISGSVARPHVQHLLRTIRERRTTVLVWSAGGASYIRRRAAATGFDDLIDGTFTKERRGSDGAWELPDSLRAAPPCVLVDDQPDELPQVGQIVGVRPFIGRNPRDHELLDLLGSPDLHPHYHREST